MLEIDANELNSVFASRHFIIFRIGKMGNYPFVTPNDVQAEKLAAIRTLLFLRMTLGQPNSDFTLSPPPSDD